MRLSEILLFAALLSLAAITGAIAQDKKLDVHVVSVKLAPGKPIVIPGCKVETSGGYLQTSFNLQPWATLLNKSNATDEEWRAYYLAQRDLGDAEIGAAIRADLKRGIIDTLYPDYDGIFITSECQK
jgi:hypothetical protein